MFNLKRNVLFLRENNVSPDYYDNALLSKNLFLRAYHNNRYKAALKELTYKAAFNNQNLILDVGCNGGTFIRFLLNFLRSEIVGVDPSSPHITHAKLNTHPSSFVEGVGEHLPFRSDTFDAITCLEVLEHSYSPENFVEEVYRVLKPGGVAVFMAPNEASPTYKTLWTLWKYLGSGRVWDKLHLNKFNKSQLTHLLKSFKLLKIKTINLTMLILIVAKKEADIQ